jgi:DNA-binding NarL/FixJ family response regulator
MSVPLKTRILLADNHAIVRGGLRMVLDAEPDLEVVHEASDGVEAVQIVLRDGVDLAVLDVSMPRMTGLQSAREITTRQPQTRVLMLSMHDNEQYFFEALKAGASGYVLKTAANAEFVEACRATMREAVPLPVGRRRAYPRLPGPRPARGGDARGPAHAARAGRPQADRRRPHQRGDRRHAVHQQEDG